MMLFAPTTAGVVKSETGTVQSNSNSPSIPPTTQIDPQEVTSPSPGSTGGGQPPATHPQHSLGKRSNGLYSPPTPHKTPTHNISWQHSNTPLPNPSYPTTACYLPLEKGSGVTDVEGNSPTMFATDSALNDSYTDVQSATKTLFPAGTSPLSAQYYNSAMYNGQSLPYGMQGAAGLYTGQTVQGGYYRGLKPTPLPTSYISPYFPSSNPTPTHNPYYGNTPSLQPYFLPTPLPTSYISPYFPSSNPTPTHNPYYGNTPSLQPYFLPTPLPTSYISPYFPSSNPTPTHNPYYGNTPSLQPYFLPTPLPTSYISPYFPSSNPTPTHNPYYGNTPSLQPYFLPTPLPTSYISPYFPSSNPTPTHNPYYGNTPSLQPYFLPTPLPTSYISPYFPSSNPTPTHNPYYGNTPSLQPYFLPTPLPTSYISPYFPSSNPTPTHNPYYGNTPSLQPYFLPTPLPTSYISPYFPSSNPTPTHNPYYGNTPSLQPYFLPTPLPTSYISPYFPSSNPTPTHNPYYGGYGAQPLDYGYAAAYPSTAQYYGSQYSSYANPAITTTTTYQLAQLPPCTSLSSTTLDTNLQYSLNELSPFSKTETKKTKSKKKKISNPSPSPEGEFERVFIWDMDDVAVLFSSLLNGAYALKFGKSQAEQSALAKIGMQMQELCRSVAENQFVVNDLEDCDQVHIEDVGMDETGQEIAGYNFAAEGFQLGGGGALCLGGGAGGMRGGVDWMRKLACRYRRVRDIYALYKDNVAGLLGSGVKGEQWAQLRGELESLTDAWHTLAFKCLAIIAQRQRHTNVIVSTNHLVHTAAMVLVYGLGGVFPIENMYSAAKIGREACFERIMSRFGKKSTYVVIGTGEEETITKQMQLPFWRISTHSDLAALHHALDLGHL